MTRLRVVERVTDVHVLFQHVHHGARRQYLLGGYLAQAQHVGQVFAFARNQCASLFAQRCHRQDFLAGNLALGIAPEQAGQARRNPYQRVNQLDQP